ncbi:MAG: hypothetical protein QOH46_599, partial [Solirubrobacteraceae bacterium]|nr:hypothetical protein [Solirubrobacteraceae bacterium]
MSASRHCLRFKTARLAAAVCGLVAAFAAMIVVPSANAAVSTNLFAVVNASGGQVAGNGVKGITQLGVGRYEVTFTQDVSSCAYVATTQNAFTQATQVFTAGGHSGPQGVYVETKNQGGGLTSGPFHLAVNCGTTGTQNAVVGYKGEL